jgi:hypothetical protein
VTAGPAQGFYDKLSFQVIGAAQNPVRTGGAGCDAPSRSDRLLVSHRLADNSALGVHRWTSEPKPVP